MEGKRSDQFLPQQLTKPMRLWSPDLGASSQQSEAAIM